MTQLPRPPGPAVHPSPHLPGRRRSAARPWSCLLLALAAGLGACSPAADDLDAWMQQQRAATQPAPTALPEYPAFTPLDYAAHSRFDPFDPRRSNPPAAAAVARAGAELARPRGPLESRPLEEIKLVGTLAGASGVQALVRIDGRLYPVRPGDHLGRNRGRVVRIDERHIELRELVQDASGAWAERTAMLKIQEASR
jgi:type IV pilus assembly protein PilP